MRSHPSKIWRCASRRTSMRCLKVVLLALFTAVLIPGLVQAQTGSTVKHFFHCRGLGRRAQSPPRGHKEREHIAEDGNQQNVWLLEVALHRRQERIGDAT